MSENKQWKGHLLETERDKFRKALVTLQYEIGVQVAVIGEVWHVVVPKELIPKDLMVSLFPGLKTRD